MNLSPFLPPARLADYNVLLYSSLFLQRDESYKGQLNSADAAASLLSVRPASTMFVVGILFHNPHAGRITVETWSSTWCKLLGSPNRGLVFLCLMHCLRRWWSRPTFTLLKFTSQCCYGVHDLSSRHVLQVPNDHHSCVEGPGL